MTESVSIDQELERVALSISIPPCPAVLTDLSAEAAKDDPDTKHIEKLVSMDVGLTAALLKTVNSPYFGLSTKVSTVRQAISILGFTMMARTVSGLVLRNVFAGKDRASMELFWDSSAKLAMITAFIAKQIPGLNKEEAYTYALFQNCGIPILMQRFPDYSSTYERASKATDRKFTVIEEEVHGTNHATLGYLLTRSWHLPEDISNAIRFHHDCGILADPTAKLSPTSTNLMALGLLADNAVAEHAGEPPSFDWLSEGEIALNHLAVSNEEFSEIVSDVKIILE